MRKGLLIVVSGPSGAGKGTVLRRIMQEMDNIQFSISATTRSPRPGESDGVNYFFISKEKFEKMLESGEFLEAKKVYENYYGTPKKYVEALRDKGIDVVLEIDTQGALQVMNDDDRTVSIFLTPPDKKTLLERLVNRATESEGDLKMRIEWAHEEYKKIPHYQYVVINDTVDNCVNDVKAIIYAERLKTTYNTEFIDKIIDEKL